MHPLSHPQTLARSSASISSRSFMTAASISSFSSTRHVCRSSCCCSSSSSFPLANRRFHSSRLLSASHTIMVPGMGDSITEGTVAEILMPVGSPVAVDDVLARLDTDKVSVDIRSTVAGVLGAWHAKVGDTVKVGSPLLGVEVGAVAAKSAAPANVPAPAAPATVAPIATLASFRPSQVIPDTDVSTDPSSPKSRGGTTPPVASHPSDDHARVPSIHFRFGKRDAAAAVVHASAGVKVPPPQSSAAPAAPVFADADFAAANNAAMDAYDALPARYKKTPMKEAYLSMIELGGAPNYEAKKKARAA